MTQEKQHAHPWWRSAVIYQIYPRSFQDSNGDGIGDLNGIKSRLDYLKALGVDAIWISPIFPSPMKDFGYDVSDYRGIDPIFGNLKDFDALLKAAHDREMRVLLDFVPSHTSDEHPWFIDSRSSKTSTKRDWYIWSDPKDDGCAPTNWVSNFGGPAWTFDQQSGQYYMHSFLKEQPDLNWRNPQVAEAMLANIAFWLDRGVDGFRIDALHHVIKDDQLRDNPLNPNWREGMSPYTRLLDLYTTDRPELTEVIAAMRRLFDRYGDRVTIGEMYLPLERLMVHYGEHEDGLHLPFNFQLVSHHAPWRGTDLAQIIERYENALPKNAWPNWVMSNHDKPRVATRLGRDKAAIAALLLLTLRGTPTLYYGDELGMEDVRIPPDRVQDPFEKNVPGLGLGRDPARTPMPWNEMPHAGFSSVEPWLPLGPDWQEKNVNTQRRQSDSLLNFYAELLDLRQTNPALALGEYRTIAATEEYLAYERSLAGEKTFLICLNLSDHEVTMSGVDATRGRIALSTDGKSKLPTNGKLAPNQGLVIEIT